ncbi:MAG: chitobiase/beta-hexosaminidase C-terminal domain-containing protein [Bacteroidales bacterium]
MSTRRKYLTLLFYSANAWRVKYNSRIYRNFKPTGFFLPPADFYDTAFNLVISHEDTTVQIIYTLDGSEPREDNFDGTVYHYKLSYPQDPGDPFGPMLTDTFLLNYMKAPFRLLINQESLMI